MPDLSPTQGSPDAGKFGAQAAGEGIVRQFDDIDGGRFERAEVVGEEGKFTACGLGELWASRLVSNGEINVEDCPSTALTRVAAGNRPAMMVPGKPGLESS